MQSLCNACGIRQRKARRAMAAAAAAAANGTAVGTETSPMKMKLPNKEKKMHTSNVGQQKKLCKPSCPPPTEKKLCFEDFTSSICKNSGFRRVFPRDEEEAAILLMALSCDLVYSWLIDISAPHFHFFLWIMIKVLSVNESELIICFTIADLQINIIEYPS